MIRWTEQKDCYRLEISHETAGTLLGGLGAFLIALCAMAVLGMVSFGVTKSALAVVGVMAMIAVYCLGESASYHQRRGWVEVSIRGGTARWSSGTNESLQPVEVARFELVEAQRELSIHALLRDGARRCVLGPWGRVSADHMRKLAEDLNANLGTVESTAATLQGNDGQ